MGPSGRSLRPALSGILLIVLVVAIPATLPVLAYASPPHPSWLYGLWDDGDYDHIVALVTSATANMGPVAPADLEPSPLLIGTLPHPPERASAVLPANAVRSRAPPAS